MYRIFDSQLPGQHKLPREQIATLLVKENITYYLRGTKEYDVSESRLLGVVDRRSRANILILIIHTCMYIGTDSSNKVKVWCF